MVAAGGRGGGTFKDRDGGGHGGGPPVNAAVEENVIPENFTYTCNGVINVAGTKIHCHKRAGHFRARSITPL